jgi:hypothetical protein
MSELLPIEGLDELANSPGSLGSSPDEAVLSEAEELTLELVQLGVGLRKAESLVRKYSPKRLRKQLRWLPHRSPRRPASMIIAAIENDYDKPAYADGQ